MSDKAWKKAERKTAVRLGGRRIPVTGIDRHGADVETPLLCVQQKLGRNRPAFLKEWIHGIRGTAKARGKIGIVVWTGNREKHGESLVILTLADFQELHGVLPPVPADAD